MEYFAEKYRPQTFDDVVGQSHLVNKNAMLRKTIEANQIFNMIFFGPPGTGKSTLAHVIANMTKRKFVKMNAVDLSVKDIKAELKGDEDGFILLIDEIHLLNKKQQQSLLEATEEGRVSLIGLLSENPYFSLHKALLSRSLIFQFNPISAQDVEIRLNTIIKSVKNDYCPNQNLKIDGPLLKNIASMTNGDSRSALNVLQAVFFKNYDPDADEIVLHDSDLNDLTLQGYHDRDGDEHYNTLSAFHKSLRGSDENAVLFYLAKLIEADDIQGIIRRLLCVASEDVGMANPNAVVVVKSCIDSALMLGFPEARLPLAEAAVYLARQPKSNSVYEAIDQALRDARIYNNIKIPDHLKDAHYSGASKINNGAAYKYPHDYPNHWVRQTYMPNELSDRTYYHPGNNKTELGYESAWKKIK